MRHKQLLLLFICHSVPPIVGMGLFPILPLFAAQLGATPTMIGLYFASMSVASLLASLASSRLGARISRKRVFVGAGAAGVPALMLLGHATAFWQAVVLTAVVWFLGSTCITLINVFTGELADSRTRGRAFAVLFLSFPLGAAVGGAVGERLVAYGGYSFMFTMLGLSWALLPVLGAIGLSETRPQQQTRVIQAAQPPRLGPTFGLLLAAALLSSAALNLSRLSTSLVMQALEFVPGAISSTGVVAGLATIPVLLVLGRFADQLGHRRVVALSYGLTLVGALVLSVASQLWHFQLAATLLFVAWCTRGSATAALTTALVPQSALGVALPQINAIENLAGIVGFASAGWLLDAAGERGLFVIAAGLLVGAIQLMGLLSHRMRVAASAAAAPAVRGAGGARAQVEAAQP